MKKGLVVALVALAWPSSWARAQEEEGVTVLRGVTVLTMEETSPLADGAVVVRGGRVTWVGPVTALEVPAGARVIEGGGRYLLPGLADMHVHMSNADVALFLANGVTTVREMNGAAFHLALRDSIRSGQRIGPRMFVTSPLLSGDQQQWRHRLIEGPESARAAASDAVRNGYDALKVYDGLDVASYRALVAAGAESGLPLVGHIPEAVGLEAVLEAGQRTIEHTEQIMYRTVGHAPDASRIPEIVTALAEGSTWVVPTLAAQRILSQQRTSAYNARFDAPEMAFVDAGTLGWWRSLAAPEGATDPSPEDPRRRRSEAFYGFQRDLVAALSEAGVPLLVGTDTPNPMLVPGYSIHHEIAALLDAGLSPMQILRAATVDAARFVGQQGEWGVVAPDAAADLVLVDGDPLIDPGVLRRPAAVMVGGTWLTRADLDRMLEER